MISIVVPVYNAAGTLGACVESLTAQTYKDIEIILVDDGSKDNSGALCDLLASKDSRIKVIHKENGGVSSARNCGLETATGKYVMFCDSDDTVNAEWCNMMRCCAEKYKDFFPICEIKRILKDGSEELYTVSQNDDKNIGITAEGYLLYNSRSLLYLNQLWLLNAPYNKIFKRSVLESNKIRFDETISNGEDAVFNFEYIRNTTGDIIFIKNPLYNYLCFSENSLSCNEPLYGAVTKSVLYLKFSEMLEAMGLLDNEYRDAVDYYYFNLYVRMLKRCAYDKGVSLVKRFRTIIAIESLPAYQRSLSNQNKKSKIYKLAQNKKRFAFYLVSKAFFDVSGKGKENL